MFKEGDTVVMHTCGEAEHYEGKLWTCTGDEFSATNGSQVVFLEGFSGYFLTKYLQKIDLSGEIKDLVKKVESYQTSTHINHFLQELMPNENGEIPLIFEVHGVSHTIGITERDARSFSHSFKMQQMLKNH